MAKHRTITIFDKDATVTSVLNAFNGQLADGCGESGDFYPEIWNYLDYKRSKKNPSEGLIVIQDYPSWVNVKNPFKSINDSDALLYLADALDDFVCFYPELMDQLGGKEKIDYVIASLKAHAFLYSKDGEHTLMEHGTMFAEYLGHNVSEAKEQLIEYTIGTYLREKSGHGL